MHDIQESMSAISPDNHNRRNVYYLNRNCSELHVPIPEGYDVDTIWAINSIRSDGWEVANARED